VVLRALIARGALRPGDLVEGRLGPAPGGRGRALTTVTAVNGADPAQALGRPHFADLTAVYPRRAAPGAAARWSWQRVSVGAVQERLPRGQRAGQRA
jgi:transcription termination factor Rho